MRRRRECSSCGHRFTSFERVAADAGDRPQARRTAPGVRAGQGPGRARAGGAQAARCRGSDRGDRRVDRARGGGRERAEQQADRRALPLRPARGGHDRLPALRDGPQAARRHGGDPRRAARPRSGRGDGGRAGAGASWSARAAGPPRPQITRTSTRKPTKTNPSMRKTWTVMNQGEQSMPETDAPTIDETTLETARRAAEEKGLRFDRRFTTEGIHPFDEIEWELRDAIIGDPAKPAFEQRERRVPRSPGRRTRPTSSPRSTSAARSARPSASARSSRWSAASPARSPAGAARAATSPRRPTPTPSRPS